MSAGFQATDEETLASTLAGDLPRLGLIEPGTVVGRYTIAERVGAGGMGTVYAAVDPELDRRVALKVLHREGRGESLLREAKTLASLSHPNVVGIFDAGSHDGHVWLAMELVQGRPLSTWLREERRPWQEILGVLLAAGDGLAAAHDAGVVHRDFKPDNVMLSDDGRALVMDFGLASTRDPSHTEDEHEEAATPNRIVGTPAYMAPEQFGGTSAGAPADQFAFCVSLWEALYGQRPFAGTTVPEIAASVTDGKVEEPPADRGVPLWLQALLRRGLLPQPSTRWPSLAHLLDALREHPARRRRRAWLALALLVGGGIAVGGWLDLRNEKPCEGAHEHIEEVWNQERRVAVAAAIDALELPYGAVTRDTLLRELDGYSDTWVAEHRDACLATAVRHEQPPETLDRRIDCLDRGRAQLDATVLVLLEADALIAQRATALLDGLPALSRCSDVDALDEFEVPAAIRAQVEATTLKINEGEVLLRAGRDKEALEVVADLDGERAQDLHPTLVAPIALLEGKSLQSLVRLDEAAVALERAMESAVSLRQEELAAEAAAELAVIQAGHLEQPAAAHVSMRVALVQAARAGTPKSLMGAHNAAAAILLRKGDFERVEQHALVLAEQESQFGRDSINAHVLLSQAKAGQHDGEAAVAHAQRGVELGRARLGDRHPSLASALEVYASALIRVGRTDEAVSAMQQVLRIREATYGPQHPVVAQAWSALGSALSAQGQHTEAVDALQAALDTQLATAGAEAAVTCVTRNNLALALQRVGKPLEAEAQLREVVRVREKRLDGDHLQLATSRANLGLALLAQDQTQEAATYLRQAAEGMHSRLGPDSIDTIRTESMLGQSLVAMGKFEDAEPLLRRAWDKRGEPGFASAAIYGASHLVRCLWADPRRRTAAIGIAKEAVELAEAESLPAGSTQVLRDWLETHRL